MTFTSPPPSQTDKTTLSLPSLPAPYSWRSIFICRLSLRPHAPSRLWQLSARHLYANTFVWLRKKLFFCLSQYKHCQQFSSASPTRVGFHSCDWTRPQERVAPAVSNHRLNADKDGEHGECISRVDPYEENKHKRLQGKTILADISEVESVTATNCARSKEETNCVHLNSFSLKWLCSHQISTPNQNIFWKVGIQFSVVIRKLRRYRDCWCISWLRYCSSVTPLLVPLRAHNTFSVVRIHFTYYLRLKQRGRYSLQTKIWSVCKWSNKCILQERKNTDLCKFNVHNKFFNIYENVWSVGNTRFLLIFVISLFVRPSPLSLHELMR